MAKHIASNMFDLPDPFNPVTRKKKREGED
jgi:hypothetical protein